MHTNLNNKTTARPPDVLTSDGSLDVARIKRDFPILNQQVHGHRLVYLDNAATSQKPQSVIDAITAYYKRQNANIHRGLHFLAEEATAAYEQTREHAARFIGGVDRQEIVFTRGTTEGINLLAYTWGEENIGEGDEIVISEMEHHANLVPWVMLAQRKGATLRRIPLTVCGHLDLSNIDDIITSRCKLLAISHMSNVLGTINPVAELAEKAHKVGALVLADGAQAAPHMPVDVRDLGVDFYALSSHKMLGPTGVGVLYGRKELLDQMPPFNFGGEMIDQVYFDKVTWAELPHKFEAGTPDIANVVAFDAALTYLEQLGMENIRRHEIELTAYALERLSELEGLELQGPREAEQRGGAVSFVDPNIHPHDISTFLDSRGVAVRAGHHCCQPLMRLMGIVATARASLYVYNDEADVDALVEALKEMRSYFGV